jgi:hypothetical protein
LSVSTFGVASIRWRTMLTFSTISVQRLIAGLTVARMASVLGVGESEWRSRERGESNFALGEVRPTHKHISCHSSGERSCPLRHVLSDRVKSAETPPTNSWKCLEWSLPAIACAESV